MDRGTRNSRTMDRIVETIVASIDSNKTIKNPEALPEIRAFRLRDRGQFNPRTYGYLDRCFELIGFESKETVGAEIIAGAVNGRELLLLSGSK